MRDIPGKVIWVIVFFMILISFYSITTSEVTMLDKRALYIDICDFVDGVVDSRQITESELREFNAKIASYGFTVDYTISRLVRSVNPDPLNSGEYVTTWIEVDDNMNYNQGDKIVVHVWQVGNTRSQNVLSGIISQWVPRFDEQVPARIR